MGNIADIIAFTNYTPWESSYDNEVNNITSACSELWTRMFIWWDGKVNPCDYDYKSYLSKWNLKDQKITDVWNSKEYNSLKIKSFKFSKELILSLVKDVLILNYNENQYHRLWKSSKKIIKF